MPVWYELWDTVSGNLLETFDCKEDVKRFLRSIQEDYGSKTFEHWDLLAGLAIDEISTIAYGEASLLAFLNKGD